MGDRYWVGLIIIKLGLFTGFLMQDNELYWWGEGRYDVGG